MRRLLASGFLMVLGSWSAWAAVDADLISLVPADSKMVAGIDADKCRNSDFGQYLLSNSQWNSSGFASFMTETGFDPRRDLQSVVAASAGVANSGNGQPMVLAKGIFDEAKIRSMAVSKGAVVRTYQGKTLLIQSDHGREKALAFPQAGLAVFGDVEAVHQVIAAAGAPSTIHDASLKQAMETANSTYDAWVVTGSSPGAALDLLPDAGDSGNLQALKSVRSVAAGVTFNSIVAVTVDAAARSEQDAVSLADVLRFGLSGIQLNRAKDPRAGILAASIDNMQLQTKGSSVHLALQIPEKSLEQLAVLHDSKRAL